MNFIIKKYSKPLIVFIATVTSSLAQNIDPIKLVLEINREVLASEKAYLGSKEKIKISGVLPDPMLETSFSINSIETRNGPIENQIMLGQRFPLWGKLKRERNIEKIRADISRLNLDKTKVKDPKGKVWNMSLMKKIAGVVGGMKDEKEEKITRKNTAVGVVQAIHVRFILVLLYTGHQTRPRAKPRAM